MQSVFRNLFMVLLGSLLGAALVVSYVELRPEVSGEPPPVQAAAPAAMVESQFSLFDEELLASIYERLAPAVVNVTNRQSVSNSSSGSQFPESGIGSGVIIDDEGHILTNNHVIDGADRLDVTLSDGTRVPAMLMGQDPGNDLAVVKIEVTESVRSRIAVATLGDSDALRPGQMAIAIGNPFGFRSSMTTGIISSVGRTFPGENGRAIRNMIQTDAAINPGNSGGPLINSAGQVIGINTAIESPVRGFVGIGFAVPINSATRVLPDMLAGSTVEHPWMGVSGITIASDVAQAANLTTTRGVYVVHVLPGSPAEEAGLRGAISADGDAGDPALDELPAGGDVITAVDGRPVEAVEELVGYVDTRQVGDSVALSILRDGTPMELRITLGSWPAS